MCAAYTISRKQILDAKMLATLITVKQMVVAGIGAAIALGILDLATPMIGNNLSEHLRVQDVDSVHQQDYLPDKGVIELGVYELLDTTGCRVNLLEDNLTELL